MFRRMGRGRKACAFCVEKVDRVDYKSVNRLRRYMSDRSRIDSGKKTGTCARHQRMVRLAIKRARLMGLLPFAGNHLRVTNPVSTGVAAGPRGPGQPVALAEEKPIAEELSESADSAGDVSQDEPADGEKV
jgi:small subunit ribosomal protein S18